LFYKELETKCIFSLFIGANRGKSRKIKTHITR
jgi:hypothetical protein